MRDRLGTTRSITTRAHITPGLKHDLLSGKALNRAGYRVILDADNDMAGVFAVANGHIDKAKSFPFMSELSSLYYLKIEKMSATDWERNSGGLFTKENQSNSANATAQCGHIFILSCIH